MKNVREIVRSVLLEEGIINEAERKMVLYHGSPYVFEDFKDKTTFFSETKEFAADYSDQKSFDYALDREPNIYKVEVLTDLFDINDPEDFKLLSSKMSDKVEYTYNNFGFTAEVDKEDILQNLRGFDTIDPYEPAINANIGGEISNPEYKIEKFIIVKKDDEYAYGFNKSKYQRMIDNLTTSPLDLKGSYPKEYKELSKSLQQKVKEIYSNETEKSYVSDNDIKAAVSDANKRSGGYNMTQLSDNALAQIKSIYDKAVSSVMDMLPGMDYLKKFPVKEKIVELDDTWRFYENKHVSGLIAKLGFGGYVAKEKNIKTYAIFHPNKDVKILEYEIPQGIKFPSWEEYQNYLRFNKSLADKLPKGTYFRNRWEIYYLYKSGISMDDAWEEVKKNKEDYLYTY